jgi:hypothetical protein
MYASEMRVFLVRLCWVTGLFKQCKAALRNRFRITAPSTGVIQKMVWELETKGILQTQHGGGRSAVTGNTAQDMRQRLPASPAKSLLGLSQEAVMSYALRQRAARKGWIHRTMLLLSRNSILLTCRKGRSTASGFKQLLPITPRSWTLRGYLLKHMFTCRGTSTHNIHRCGLLQILM